jgi:O-antigen ligase
MTVPRLLSFTGLSAVQITAYTLIFLFPILGNTVKSWTGVTFSLLVITTLFYLKHTKPTLSKRELTLLVIMLAIFFVTTVSNIVNGWEYSQTRGLGVYLRWLLFIPIYWAIRDLPKIFFWLANGTVLAAFVLFFQSFYDVYLLKTDRSYGVYDSPGLVGVQSLIFTITLIGAAVIHNNSKKLTIFYCLGGLAALGSLFLSGSRSTYFLIALLVPCLILISFNFKKALLILSLVTFSTVLFFSNNAFLRERVQSGLKETRDYFQAPNPASMTHRSVGTRLEMWKVSVLIAKENPIIGVGWRNFQKSTKPFVDQGLVSISASQHPHPHNMYLEFLVTTGLCVLLLITSLFIHAAHTAYQSAQKHPITGKLLLTFILVFVFNGINEGGAFSYGNALSFFLVYLAVFFSTTQSKSVSDRPRLANH